MIDLIPNVRVVLVNTTHPGNIGAAARAMKTMGLSELVLVDPLLFPHPVAQARATSAIDVLDQARRVATLEEAISDCGLVIGASAQSRHLPWPMLGPRELGPTVHATRQTQPVALVFGRERDGLNNEELQLCHFHVQIPTHPTCRSLNLAQAVQVLCYEVMMSNSAPLPPPEETIPLSTPAEMALFYEHLERTLVEIEFLKPDHPKKLMSRLKRLFNRARPDQNEMNILRGILSAIK